MNKEQIRTEKERKKERKRINCTKQKLAPNGSRRDTAIDENEKDGKR
jgi:hypothetical protein